MQAKRCTDSSMGINFFLEDSVGKVRKVLIKYTILYIN